MPELIEENLDLRKEGMYFSFIAIKHIFDIMNIHALTPKRQRRCFPNLARKVEI